VGRYQKGKTNQEFTEARDSEWQWHQLGHMQVCTSLQTDIHASTSPLSFLQAGCPSCLIIAIMILNKKIKTSKPRMFSEKKQTKNIQRNDHDYSILTAFQH